jgi:Ser/Thr protein kinase RdoA (MazF antagonist)
LASHEIPVVAPLVHNVQSLHIYNGFCFAAFLSVGGQEFEVDNLDHVEWMGRFIGRIHAVSKSSNFVYRPSINVDEHLRIPLHVLQNSSFIPSDLHQSFFTILQQVADLALSLYVSTNNIRLQGDCHPGNILWRNGPTYVDLDDCNSETAI